MAWINKLTGNVSPGKYYTGEGSANFKNLEKPVWRQREDNLTSLELYYLLKLTQIAAYH